MGIHLDGCTHLRNSLIVKSALVLALAAVCVLLLAIGASAPPALRAASVQPMQALRGE